VNEIRAAVVRIMDDRPVRIDFGRNAVKAAQELYDWQNITARQVAIYQDVITGVKRIVKSRKDRKEGISVNGNGRQHGL
jgi:hypothetical protein